MTLNMQIVAVQLLDSLLMVLEETEVKEKNILTSVLLIALSALVYPGSILCYNDYAEKGHLAPLALFSF